jgi:hypothetical protein
MRRQRPGSGSQAPVLALTATIDPGRTPYVTVRDPAVRLEEYQVALRRWLRLRDRFSAILWVENSGHRAVDRIEEEFSKDVTVVRAPEDPGTAQRGKGLGEVGLLWELYRCGLIPSDGYLVKCTGRLFVRRSGALLRALDGAPDLVVRLRRDFAYADARFFALRTSRLERVLRTCSAEIDDTRGRYFEHALARATLTEVVEGARLVSWPEPLLFAGRSGSSGERYDSPRQVGRWLLAALAHRVGYLTKWL